MAVNQEFFVDTLGQSRTTDFLTNVFTFYQVPTSTQAEKEAIFNRIQSATNQVIEAFPWLAGIVVQDSPRSFWKIVPDPEQHSTVVINDYTADPTHPSFIELKTRGFPMRLLDEKLYVARCTFPGHKDRTHVDSMPHPVWCLQINYLRGGVLIATTTSHISADMTSHTSIIRMISQCCEPGGRLTPKEIAQYNHPGRSLVDVSNTELCHEMAQMPDTPEWWPRYDKLDKDYCGEWEYFLFTPEAQARLKAVAQATKPTKVPFVSTDDAITALFWRQVTVARGYQQGKICRHYRTVDVREMLGIERHYLGVGLSFVRTEVGVDKVIDSPLGYVATLLRDELSPSKLSTRCKRMIKELEQPNAQLAPNLVVYDEKLDFLMSSWAKRDNYPIQLGMGKGPEAVRVPAMAPIHSLGFIMPKKPNGDIEVAFCVTREVLGKLLEDEEFTAFAKLM